MKQGSPADKRRGAGGGSPQDGGKPREQTPPSAGGKGAARQSRANRGRGACSLSSKPANPAKSRANRGPWRAYDPDLAFDRCVWDDALTEEQLRRIIDEERRPVYATKTTRAGTVMEVQAFPEFTRLPGWAKRPQDVAAHKRINEMHSRQRCEQAINATFTEDDYWLTLSYYPANVPQTWEQLKQDAANYMRRVNYHRKKAGLAPAKRVIVPDWTKDGHRVQAHLHIVVEGGLPLERMIELWGLGRRNEGRRLYKDERGLSGLANYITKPHAPDGKEKKHKKAWLPSKNLTRPAQRKNHKTFGRRAVERMAEAQAEVATEMERRFPGWWCESGEAMYNGVNGLFYIRAQLRQKAAPGDVVRITGQPEGLDAAPMATRRALRPGGKYRVVLVDDTAPGGRVVLETMERTPRRIEGVPARACIVVTPARLNE